jgi:hypothetical protein
MNDGMFQYTSKELRENKEMRKMFSKKIYKKL